MTDEQYIRLADIWWGAFLRAYERPNNKDEEAHTGSIDGGTEYHSPAKRLAPTTMASNEGSTAVAQ